MVIRLTKKAWATEDDQTVEVDKDESTILFSDGYSNINLEIDAAKELIEVLQAAIEFYEED